MKKKLSKKLLWQSFLSLVVLGGFICLASESGNVALPDRNVTFNPSTKEYTESWTAGNSTAKKIGKIDDDGLWHGWVITNYYNKQGELTGKLETYFINGLAHGTETWIRYSGGMIWSLKEYCYYKGWGGLECSRKNASLIDLVNTTAFDILLTKYPLDIVPFQASGIDSISVKAYVDTIETKLFKMEFDESEFNDKYDEVMGDMEYSLLDTVWQIHDQEAYYQGFYYLKFAEFRRAVVDAYRSEPNNTYSTIKTMYPNYNYLETWTEYLHLKDSLFQIFCTDFDNFMVSYGPVDIQDPFYVDSIDIRMLNSLVSLILDESSTEASLVLKSRNLPKKMNSLSSLRKVALPVLEQIRADSLSSVVATYVGYTLVPHFYEGDKIRKAVREAYNLQKGIVTVPVTATELLENISTTSVRVRGNVFEDGEADVTERGITWATHYNPTIEDNLEPSGAGLGAYTITLNGLSPGATYYARSYATNSKGTAYGNCISFVAGTAVGVDDIEMNDLDFKVYPNPTSDITTFSFRAEPHGSMVLTIVNLKGQIVLQKDLVMLQQGENQVKLNLSNLENGIYSSCLINNGTIKVTRKFLIAH